MAWIDDVTKQIGEAHGIDSQSISVSESEAEVLLELAGLAAHSSGARTNAPLLCHVLGRARSQGISLEALSETVRAAVK
ncbi:unannotated protein [freshwater metagenome]|uniref:Unannotated protein n=1 Tax=freshwater metagenome TaxID=449393 RepID=A0A6J6WZH5_9ZZZZ|nr:hypothetical protein [Actinomycetota bacterium]MSX81431.1 hypothetical protein [Actinomycetota bacterium]